MDLEKMGSSLKIYYNLDRLNVNILDRQICGIKGWEQQFFINWMDYVLYYGRDGFEIQIGISKQNYGLE